MNGTGTIAAINFDAEKTMNLVPEEIENTIAENQIWLRRRQGYVTFAGALGAGPVRGLFCQDGRVFCVSGNTFYELFFDGTSTNYGLVNTDSRPAFVASNGQIGHQLLVVSGGSGYVFDLNANTLSAAIAQPGFPANALSCIFADSYFIALANGQPEFAFSSLADGTTWSGLDVAEKSQTSDNLLAMVYDHKELWLVGSKNIEVWVDTGDANNPWSPQPILVEAGLAAQDSIAQGDDSIFWLKSGPYGALSVVRAQGYNTLRISTHAIENTIAGYSRFDDALGFYYEDQGHGFYVLSFPTADATLVYDVRTQRWHERGYWDAGAGVFHADLGRCHCWAPSFNGGQHLFGSRVDGTVYVGSWDVNDDAGNDIRWLRRAPHIHDQGHRVFISRFELFMRTGVGNLVAPGTDPQIVLRISRDGGNTYGTQKQASLGPYQQFLRRVFFTRCGHVRNGVFEVSGTDPVFVGIADAWLDAQEGLS